VFDILKNWKKPEFCKARKPSYIPTSSIWEFSSLHPLQPLLQFLLYFPFFPFPCSPFLSLLYFSILSFTLPFPTFPLFFPLPSPSLFPFSILEVWIHGLLAFLCYDLHLCFPVHNMPFF
jgi:hypothetical protein